MTSAHSTPPKNDPVSAAEPPVSTRVVLLRHGQTEYNRTQRMQGHDDIPLNDTGREQARAVAEVLATRDIAALYSSDLSRAYETARPVAELTGLEIQTDQRLREVNIGTWGGLYKADVIKEFPEYETYIREGWEFRRSATGENLQDVVDRGVPAVRDIVERHRGQEVLVVAHGLLLIQTIQALLNFPHGQRVLGALRNAHYAELDFREDRVVLESYNVGVPGH